MKLCTVQLDIKTVFIYSELDEDFYMRITAGYVRYIL
jgi:hypothetical protein